jgi:predicted TIM-barrel fold metal-dependent hydrolase
MLAEIEHYHKRPLFFLLLSGVFERFPRLKFVLTEEGCAWVPPLLDRLDGTLRRSAPPARSASCASSPSTGCQSRRPSTSGRTCG